MTPAELWVSITAMPRPHRVVDFPRVNERGEPVARLALIVLTQEEQITASVETEKFTRRVIKDLPKMDETRRGYDDVYNNQAAVEILHRACKQVDDMTKPFFPSTDEMRRHLTPDEIGVLFKSYLLVQDEVGPIIAKLSQEEMEAWIRRLSDGGSKVPLAALSWGAVSELAFSLACRIGKSATDTTSPGLPPESDTSTNTDFVTEDKEV